MTTEQAIKYIIQHCNPDYPKGKTEWETAINMAISALEKQIPKKPEERRDKYTGNDVMSCPNCGAYIGYRDGRTHIVSMYVASSRCPECGQTIDWE